MPKNNKENTIQTEDLHLAAYLLCQKNLEFKGIESTDHRETIQFIFIGNNGEIDRLLLDYYNRRASCEPQLYNENTGRLRDLVKLHFSRKTTKTIQEDC